MNEKEKELLEKYTSQFRQSSTAAHQMESELHTGSTAALLEVEQLKAENSELRRLVREAWQHGWQGAFLTYFPDTRQPNIVGWEEWSAKHTILKEK